MNSSKLRYTALISCMLAGLPAAAAPAAAPAAEPPAAAPSGILTPMATRHLPDEVAEGRARLVRLMDASRPLKFAVSLPARDPQGLEKLFREVSDPASPRYRQYLDGAQFNERFAPSREDYEAVLRWAEASGFRLRGGSSNRRVVALEGSVGDIDRAFDVAMTEYQHPTEDRTYFSPDREPAARGLGVALLHVTGLQDFVLPGRHMARAPEGAPASLGGTGPKGSFTPTDMRKAYYGNGPLDGAGQVVGVFSFDGYLASDLDLYYSTLNWHPTVPVKNVLVNGFSGTCHKPCDDGEQILDMTNVIGMAPGLTQLLFYEGENDVEILNRMATDNKAKILSSSWYWRADASAIDPIFQQMGVQGQTFVNATGDKGAFNSRTYDFPGVDPYILQVGGTQVTISGGAWSSETSWAQQSEGGASGGGNYKGTPIPSWQKTAGVITAANGGSTKLRNSPDVAAESSFNSSTVVNGKFETGWGGTSFGAPRWAGYLALANQQAALNGKPPVGFVDPTLYTIGLGSGFATDFHDIKTGNNRPTEGTGSGFDAVKGYDLVTGWGSPNGANLLNALANPSGR